MSEDGSYRVSAVPRRTEEREATRPEPPPYQPDMHLIGRLVGHSPLWRPRVMKHLGRKRPGGR